MEYKIAICDDEQKDRDFVAALSRRWAGQRGNTVELTEFSSAEQFLFCYGEQSDYDILLLDIEMGQMDGVQLAKQLRQKNETIQIVFVTGYSDYISEGYEVAALHYLMKPVREEKFFSVLVADGIRSLKKSMDAGEVGGTALLGISRPVIKAHGSSDDFAIKNAIRQAQTFAASGIIDDITENIDHMKLPSDKVEKI